MRGWTVWARDRDVLTAEGCTTPGGEMRSTVAARSIDGLDELNNEARRKGEKESCCHDRHGSVTESTEPLCSSSVSLQVTFSGLKHRASTLFFFREAPSNVFEMTWEVFLTCDPPEIGRGTPSRVPWRRSRSTSPITRVR